MTTCYLCKRPVPTGQIVVVRAPAITFRCCGWRHLMYAQEVWST